MVSSSNSRLWSLGYEPLPGNSWFSMSLVQLRLRVLHLHWSYQWNTITLARYIDPRYVLTNWANRPPYFNITCLDRNTRVFGNVFNPLEFFLIVLNVARAGLHAFFRILEFGKLSSNFWLLTSMPDPVSCGVRCIFQCGRRKRQVNIHPKTCKNNWKHNYRFLKKRT